MAIYNFALMEQARKKQMLQFTELAYLAGISEPHLRQILSGAKGCSEKTMWKIADVLKLSTKKLEQHKR